MRPVSRIPHRITTAGLVAASVLIGWLARSSSADNVHRHAPVHKNVELAQAPVALPTGLGTTLDAVTIVPTQPELGPPKSDQVLPDPQPLSAPPVAADHSVPPDPTTPSKPPIAADSDDPEKVVQSFVAQNQKLAEAQLKNLRDEEARLRARLQKVEAGIKRWEVLVEALKTSKTVESVAPPTRLHPPPAADTPESLDAIPKYKIGPPPSAPTHKT